MKLHVAFAAAALSTTLATVACTSPAVDENPTATGAAITEPPRIYVAAKVSPDQRAIVATLSTTASRTTDCKKLVLRAFTARSGDCGAGNETPVVLSLPATSFGANETKAALTLGTPELDAQNTAEGVTDRVYCGAASDLSEQDCGYRCIFENKEYAYGTQIRSSEVNGSGHVTITCEANGEVASDVVCAVVGGVPMRPGATWPEQGTNGDKLRTCLTTGAIANSGMSCTPGYSPVSAEACAPSGCEGTTAHGDKVIVPIANGSLEKTCSFGAWTTRPICADPYKPSNGACVPMAACEGGHPHGSEWQGEPDCCRLPGRMTVGNCMHTLRCFDGRPRDVKTIQTSGQCTL